MQVPPAMPKASSSQSNMQMVLYLPMMLGMGAMSFFYVANSGGLMLVVWGVLFGVSMLGMVVMGLGQRGMARKSQLNDERKDYLRYLDNVRRQIRRTAAQQRSAMLAVHPDPSGLAATAAARRLWERRRSDPDFGQIRFATGPQRLATTPIAPTDTPPFEDLDPVCLSSLRQFLRTYSTVPDLPIALALRSYPHLAVEGHRDHVLGVVRAMLAQLATFHSAGDLRLAVCAAPDRLPDWEWTKWLPHALHSFDGDGVGPVRLAATDLAEVESLLAPDLGERTRFSRGATQTSDQPHVVVVMDGGTVSRDTLLADETGIQGVTLIHIAAMAGVGPFGVRLVVEPERIGVVGQDAIDVIGRPDLFTEPQASLLARSMSPFHLSQTIDDDGGGGGVEPLSGTIELADLLGIGDPRTMDVAATWAPRPARNRLRIPIGIDSAGHPVELDFKESAEEGMGPHGLLIGATGSGKSELLRTLVLGLAATHSSETLNLVLVDFKGGATFAGLGGLPHTAAVITNLSDDLTLVDRMRDAVHGELIRRQELLRSAGNFSSVRDYTRAQEVTPSMAPLPTLMVIIDEFSELLTSQPDMIELFVMIGRLGRSLGVHLLLASQRLDEGRLRGLDSHLSYRIGLRTFSTSESRAVLGVPDAGELPPIPGSGFLRIDSSTLIRFKSAYVSGAVVPSFTASAPHSPGPISIRSRVLPYTLGFTPVERSPLTVTDVLQADPVATQPDPFADTVLDVMVRQMQGRGPAPHQIWLPPLTTPASLEQLLPPLAATPERGLCPAGWAGNGQLATPVGVVDRPFEQRQDLHWVDLSGANGHVAIVGGPRSGKSTLVRTLIASLALTHTPEEVQFYCLDFGGGGLSALAELPHVGGVAARLDAERCSRLVAECVALVDERERLFLEHGIDSIDTFRRRRRQGERLGERSFGDVILVVDGWLTLREDFENLYEAIVSLAGRGLAYGVHVVITASRWMDIRAQIRDLIGTRLELRLGDPSDSEIDRRAAAKVPENAPGRGMTAQKLHWLAALPRIDGSHAGDTLPDGVAALVQNVARAWPGERAPQVRLLPRLVEPSDLPTAGPEVTGGLQVPIGLRERDFKPVVLDFGVDPHLVVFGDVECGKTGLLRLLARGLAERNPPDHAKLLVVDHRRTMLGELSGEHALWYAGVETATEDLIARAASSMHERMPGPDVSAEQLRRRDWWSGAELFVLVDDHDLVSTGRSNPLEPLVPFLPHSRDIGLHLIVARRSGGVGRAMYDPVIQRLMEMGSPVLLMSGSPDEGAVIGKVKMTPQPPGRGTLVRRGDGINLVQVAWAPSMVAVS